METEIVCRESTEEEKREFLSGVVLPPYLEGTNRLAFILEKEKIPIVMADEDREEFLNRMMRIPTKEEVKQFMDTVIGRNISLVQYEDERLKLSDHEVCIKEKKNAKISVVFKHLLPPTKEEGGWEKADVKNDRLVAWSTVYTKYYKHIMENEANARHSREAVYNNLPIDVAITTSDALVEAKKKEAAIRRIEYSKEEQELDRLLRFIIFTPYPENQRGEPIIAHTVRPKNNNNKK